MRALGSKTERSQKMPLGSLAHLARAQRTKVYSPQMQGQENSGNSVAGPCEREGSFASGVGIPWAGGSWLRRNRGGVSRENRLERSTGSRAPTKNNRT
jgi:hypothetical protein